jgi:ArsR family transcriptional regulator
MNQSSRPSIYSLHAEMCKVLSNPLRLRIIDVLREGEMTVSQLSGQVGTGLATVSQHLALMRNQGILASRREGNSSYYRVANPKMLQAFDILREVLFERIEAEHSLVSGGKG